MLSSLTPLCPLGYCLLRPSSHCSTKKQAIVTTLIALQEAKGQWSWTNADHLALLHTPAALIAFPCTWPLPAAAVLSARWGRPAVGTDESLAADTSAQHQGVQAPRWEGLGLYQFWALWNQHWKQVELMLFISSEWFQSSWCSSYVSFLMGGGGVSLLARAMTAAASMQLSREDICLLVEHTSRAGLPSRREPDLKLPCLQGTEAWSAPLVLADVSDRGGGGKHW